MTTEDDRFSNIDTNFAINLRVHREARSLSQEELAQRMTDRGFGFSQATIWKIEQGKRPVKIGEAAALADALGLIGWSMLTEEPEASRHHAQLDAANRRACDAYRQAVMAAINYIEAQHEVLMAASEAHNAGVRVSQRWTTWLSTPVERATLEARVRFDGEDEATERIEIAVDKALKALQDQGFYTALRPEDVEIIPGGPLPDWTPTDTSR